MSVQQIADLEWVNYAATLALAQVTPGLDLCLRPEVIMISNEILPDPGATHACLLRTTPQTIDNLIAEVIAYFQAKSLPATIFVSPACTPADLPERLLARGFVKQQAEEAWLIFEDLLGFKVPAMAADIRVEQITEAEVLTFAHVLLTAFEMPLDFAPGLSQLLAPTLTVPGVYNYLAFIADQPVATCSLICYQNFGILGGVGVAPAYRGSRAVTNLMFRAATEAQKQGVHTFILQTTAGTLLERLLRINGFTKVFTRIGYTLP